MNLKALSHYDGDKETRFGDCILLNNSTSLVVYDCGHTKHKEEIEQFLQDHSQINEIDIVVSHNDSDHTDGIIDLLSYLYEEAKYTVRVHTPLYLKSSSKIDEILNDGRRAPEKTKEHILETFNNIKDIVDEATNCGFEVLDTVINSKIANKCIVVGPTEDEFASVVAKAIQDGETAKIDGETVMNAASVQLKVTLSNNDTVLLCGDASPSYLHNIDGYKYIQLPHHGKKDDAITIFDNLNDPYSKGFLISDNTGSGATNGGSDDLTEFMIENNYDPALNTKNGIISLPTSKTPYWQNRSQGVILGEVDCEL